MIPVGPLTRQASLSSVMIYVGALKYAKIVSKMLDLRNTSCCPSMCSHNFYRPSQDGIFFLKKKLWQLFFRVEERQLFLVVLLCDCPWRLPASSSVLHSTLLSTRAPQFGVVEVRGSFSERRGVGPLSMFSRVIAAWPPPRARAAARSSTWRTPPTRCTQPRTRC